MNKISIFLCTLAFAGAVVQAKTSTFAPVQSDIFYEIARCNNKAVKAWIKSKPDLSICNQQGQSVLTAAVLTGNFRVVLAVLRTKVDVNAVDNQGKTALDYAVQHHYDKIVCKLAYRKAQVTSSEATEYVQKVVHPKYKKVCKRVAKITGGVMAGIVLCAFGVMSGVVLGLIPLF